MVVEVMVVVVMVVLGMALVAVNVVVMVNPILDTRISSVCSDFSITLRVPWILKRVVLESSGRIASL